MNDLVREFQQEYLKEFPSESQLTNELYDYCVKAYDIKLESQYNIMFLKETKHYYYVISGFCIANNNRPREFNLNCFREVLKFVRRQNKPVVTMNLNTNYLKCTKDLGNGIRMF